MRSLSRNFQSTVAELVPYFPFSLFPPLQFGAALCSLAYSVAPWQWVGATSWI